MKINYNYIDRFIKTKDSYLYPLKKGSYFMFDLNSLEYIGILSYVITSKYIDLDGCKKLEELYAKSFLI